MFRHLEKDEMELMKFRKKNEILKGYVKEVFGPLDPKNIEENLNAVLEKRDKETV